MPADIKHEWLLAHRPEEVWELLTRPELIAQWLMPNDFKPVVGHKFQFRTDPRVKFGFDGNVYCEVLEVQPQQRLSYSWKGGPAPGKITLDSIVTWTLAPTTDGTRLLLEHTGFKGFRNLLGYLFMNAGWGRKIRRRFTSLLGQPDPNPKRPNHTAQDQPLPHTD